MINLHMHSHYSDDGEFTPKALALGCLEAGIGVFSVTDHNCVRADSEAREAAERLGLMYLSGGEFDCTYNGRNFHMLGYGIDCEKDFFAGVERAVESQSRRASLEMLEKTRALGFSVTEEELDGLSSEESRKGKWTGEMFGEVLLSKPEYEGHPLLAPYREGRKRSDNRPWTLTASKCSAVITAKPRKNISWRRPAVLGSLSPAGAIFTGRRSRPFRWERRQPMEAVWPGRSRSVH